MSNDEGGWWAWWRMLQMMSNDAIMVTVQTVMQLDFKSRARCGCGLTLAVCPRLLPALMPLQSSSPCAHLSTSFSNLSFVVHLAQSASNTWHSIPSRSYQSYMNIQAKHKDKQRHYNTLQHTTNTNDNIAMILLILLLQISDLSASTTLSYSQLLKGMHQPIILAMCLQYSGMIAVSYTITHSLIPDPCQQHMLQSIAPTLYQELIRLLCTTCNHIPCYHSP